MVKLINVDDAIEGGAIEGHSRHELKPKKPIRVDGSLYAVWTASLDVVSWITKALPEGAKRIKPTASTSLTDSVECDKVTIISIKDKVSLSVEHRSASHKASVWKFAQQTAVIVDGPHQELLNAVARSRR